MIGFCLSLLASSSLTSPWVNLKGHDLTSVFIPSTAFTLSWQHSIEKIVWEEDYRIEIQEEDKDSHGKPQPPHLKLVEARIRGNGAGMEAPEGALFKNGIWHYQPDVSIAHNTLILRRSGYVADYRLCSSASPHDPVIRCQALGDWLKPNKTHVEDQKSINAELVEIKACQR